MAADRATVEQTRSSTEAARLTVDDTVAEHRRQVEERAAEVERLAADYAEKDQSIARHAAKLKDVGAAVAAERKALAEMRTKWEAESTTALESDQKSRAELEAFRARAAAEIAALANRPRNWKGKLRPRWIGSRSRATCYAGTSPN